MQTYRDNMGQDWRIQLTLTRTRVLREKLGLDLLNPQDYLQILNSLTDRLAFVFLLCEDQAKEYEVTVDDFEERLYGDGFATAASEAFLKESASFFQKLGQEAMAGLATRSIQAMQAGQARVDDLLKSGQFDSLLDQAEKEMEAALPRSDGNGSLNSQPSPVSTPGL